MSEESESAPRLAGRFGRSGPAPRLPWLAALAAAGVALAFVALLPAGARTTLGLAALGGDPGPQAWAAARGTLAAALAGMAFATAGRGAPATGEYDLDRSPPVVLVGLPLIAAAVASIVLERPAPWPATETLARSVGALAAAAAAVLSVWSARRWLPRRWFLPTVGALAVAALWWLADGLEARTSGPPEWTRVRARWLLGDVFGVTWTTLVPGAGAILLGLLLRPFAHRAAASAGLAGAVVALGPLPMAGFLARRLAGTHGRSTLVLAGVLVGTLSAAGAGFAGGAGLPPGAVCLAVGLVVAVFTSGRGHPRRRANRYPPAPVDPGR